MSGINLESYTTGPRARRRFTAEQKLSIVQDSYEAGVLVTAVARRHNVGLSTLIKMAQTCLTREPIEYERQCTSRIRQRVKTPQKGKSAPSVPAW